jgi:hypothetical protein
MYEYVLSFRIDLEILAVSLFIFQSYNMPTILYTRTPCHVKEHLRILSTLSIHMAILFIQGQTALQFNLLI